MTSILLNGPSSSGKSSISKELQKILCNSQIVALDDYLKMSKEEPIFEDDVYDANQLLISDISKEKINIIDHVITSKRIYDELISSISDDVFSVHVTCDIHILEKREASRGNRCIGSASASLEYLYPKDGYDMKIDTSELSASDCAKLIYQQYIIQKKKD